MRIRLVTWLLLVLTASLAPAQLTAAGHAIAALPAPGADVILEARDAAGQMVADARVIVRSVTDDAWVLNGRTDQAGQFRSTSTVPAAAPAKEIVDAVYRAYVISPNGEVASTAFAVAHRRGRALLADGPAPDGGTQSVQVALPPANPLSLETASAQPSPNTVQGQARRTGSAAPAAHFYDPARCYALGTDDFVCVRNTLTYVTPTQVGRYNVSDGLRAEVTLSATATSTVEAGVKGPGGAWEVSGGVTITNGSTSTWGFTGQCLFVGRAYTCHPARIIYGTVQYKYEELERWYQDQLVWSWGEVTPLEFIGPVSDYRWEYESLNGRSRQDVRANQHGAWDEIWNSPNALGGRNRTYTREFVSAAAAAVPTPVGTFRPGVRGRHAGSNSMTYSTTTMRTFVLYDNSTGGAIWYTSY